MVSQSNGKILRYRIIPSDVSAGTCDDVLRPFPKTCPPQKCVRCHRLHCCLLCSGWHINADTNAQKHCCSWLPRREDLETRLLFHHGRPSQRPDLGGRSDTHTAAADRTRKNKEAEIEPHCCVHQPCTTLTPNIMTDGTLILNKNGLDISVPNDSFYYSLYDPWVAHTSTSTVHVLSHRENLKARLLLLYRGCLKHYSVCGLVWYILVHSSRAQNKNKKRHLGGFPGPRRL